MRANRPIDFEFVRNERSYSVVREYLQPYLPKYQTFMHASMFLGLSFENMQLSMDVAVQCLLLATTNVAAEEVKNVENYNSLVYGPEFDTLRAVLLTHLRDTKKAHCYNIEADLRETMAEMPGGLDAAPALFRHVDPDGVTNSAQLSDSNHRLKPQIYVCLSPPVRQ